MEFILLASLILYTDIMINSFWHKTVLAYESMVTYFDSSSVVFSSSNRSRLQRLLASYSIPKSSTKDVMSRNITKMSATEIVFRSSLWAALNLLPCSSEMWSWLKTWSPKLFLSWQRCQMDVEWSPVLRFFLRIIFQVCGGDLDSYQCVLPPPVPHSPAAAWLPWYLFLKAVLQQNVVV